jgi:UDP-N-acetylmuramoyl-tripeptide--D-alanyl-D-alanine ligase
MRTGLHPLAAMRGARRAIAVLGEMAELGVTAAQEQQRIGALAGHLGIDVVLAVGEHAGKCTTEGAEVWIFTRARHGVVADCHQGSATRYRRVPTGRCRSPTRSRSCGVRPR